MQMLFPGGCVTPVERLSHAELVLEHLRRTNNRLAAHFATVANAQRWHREWFRPRQLAVCRELVPLRRQVLGGPWPRPEENKPLPWEAEQRRILALRDDAPELAATRLEDIFAGDPEARELPDPTEDFTTFTEVDPNNDITRTSARVTVDTMRNDVAAYVYKDYGAGHFGNYTHDFDLRVTAGMDPASTACFWCVSNTVGTYQQCVTAKSGLVVTYGYAAPNKWLYLIDYHDISYQRYNITLGTTYYCTSVRSGTIATCTLYSDAARTLVVATLTTGCTTTTYRYAYGCQSYGNATYPASTTSGWAENLDLHEAAAGLPIPIVAHHLGLMGGEE